MAENSPIKNDPYFSGKGYESGQNRRLNEAVSHANDNVKEVLGVEGSWIDHLKHRLNPITIAKEIISTLIDKVIPQGADEIGNVLNSGSAYLPWPGTGHNKVEPMPQQEAGMQVEPEQAVSQTPSESVDKYMTGEYAPPRDDHNSLYISGQAVETPMQEVPPNSVREENNDLDTYTSNHEDAMAQYLGRAQYQNRDNDKDLSR